MKTKRYTTTEFYKKPSEAISFVKEGGSVHLGYKGFSKPIAVITPYAESLDEKKSVTLKRKKKEFTSKTLKELIVSEPELTDGGDYFFKERRKR